LRRLARRRNSRTEQGAFLVDGPVLIREALTAGVRLEALYVEPDADPALLAEVTAGSVPIHEVHDGVLAKVLQVVNPRAMVAIAEQSAHGLDEVIASAATEGRPVLVLVEVQDPGNAGTLIRVAEASGAVGVVLCSGSVDLFNPKTVRASAGSVFRVPVVQGADWDQVLSAAREGGLGVAATVPRGGSTPDELDLAGPFAVFLGSEANGLPTGMAEQADLLVTIPMSGEVESLNAAVAGAVLAFEAARQRRAAGGDA
jgi:TrmH family RNA methyltransferase